MGCFLTATEEDLKQLKQIRHTQHQQNTAPMSQDAFLDKVKKDVCDIADIGLIVDATQLETASRSCSFDQVNDVLLQFDEAVEGGWVSKEDAIREGEAILSDITKSSKIPGIADTISSPVALLSQHSVATHEWRGARFELRYAASKGNDIAEVDCRNYVDVRMKDGSYRELKSFSSYGSDQIRNVLEQLSKDIDPNNRGINDIKVVLDSSIEHPPSAFLDNLHSKIEVLVSQINPTASVGCEVMGKDGRVQTIF